MTGIRVNDESLNMYIISKKKMTKKKKMKKKLISLSRNILQSKED